MAKRIDTRTVKPRKGMPTPRLSKKEFQDRYRRQFWACFSTAAALCHWPCSCYPNHSLGQIHGKHRFLDHITATGETLTTTYSRSLHRWAWIPNGVWWRGKPLTGSRAQGWPISAHLTATAS
ncbi:hypothetical protein EN935_01570 [Mesorhizobium sp. M7D.F.Ca.US.004.03.1.1]|nr:hypothetical protein EN993_01335 [Mesorhizobium sp. M7D.F.Ca.US.004.01.2.1]RVA36700.1 hypothetical protein EN935_01570 [Mesorhizobium sp. M7D.F.Ca.US.004.03.1.1]